MATKSGATAIFIGSGPDIDIHGDEFLNYVIYAGDDDGEPVDTYAEYTILRAAAIAAAERLLIKYGVTDIEEI